jgi:predicted acyl esterase
MSDKLKNVSQPQDWKLIVEKDVQLPMRDGAILYADVLRPDTGGERVPAIMNIGPYQKDKVWMPPHDLDEAANPYLAWETGNPMYWCPRGYALVCVDSRSSGKPRSHQRGLENRSVAARHLIFREIDCSTAGEYSSGQ